MIEKRNCEFCTVPGNKSCYMKISEEINRTVDTLPDPSQELNEDEKIKKGQNIGLAVNNEISRLRDKARENYCKKVNSIISDNKWNKYL